VASRTITELCNAKGWHRGRFYSRTDAPAERVAAYLNEHAGQDVDAVQEGETAPIV
jgi:pyrroloquinoline quinone (PQQ) biosynthesis protein C